ncbi:MFS transporter [Acetobacterium woodii]|uniref:Major facilitator superfamily MFS_1 transporter n=1 Tax=Acetobacterium woodii (strain ATCC 29683 / DSM 1030 / JCM 2381 / KCTC 1655 / WB1) TaxID=931626 RepID=H6LE64_ACEWD|nr:MFS transporter [Acetobacterium woodii]AFA49297.1 major facilitator superfamily MFS_1 transporter [Acetobacterium woodii DSM 1030]
MSEQKKGSVWVSIAALSVALLLYTTSMTTPALGEIAKAFPDAAPETVKLLASIPSLMMVFFALISGKLTQYLSIKKIITIAMILIFVGGIPSAFIGDLQFMIIMRVIFGAGYGLVFPMASAVIADLFTGDQANKIMGFKSAVGAAAGMVFQMMGGILAAYNWRYSFLGFLLVIPIALIIWFKLPDTGVKKVEKVNASGGKEKKLTTMTFVLSIACALLNLVQFSFMTNLAMIITADGIGNAAQSATVLTIFTASAFVVGMIYGNISKVLKQYSASFGALMVGLSFVVLVFANSMTMLIIGAIIFGIGFGSFNPAITMAVAKSAASPKFAAVAISIYVSGTGIGQFLSPYALKFMREALNLTSARADWQIAAVSLIVGSLVSIVLVAVNSKKTEIAKQTV